MELILGRVKERNMKLLFWAVLAATGLIGSCTQEQQNSISRSIQNWTGTNGVLDVISEGKVMYRVIKIDKITTAKGTGSGMYRPYRFGYGVLDVNQNYVKDPGEHESYFEISDYGTSYFFYENPLRKK